MKRDKNRPSTWVRYFQGLCKNCLAGCCTMPVEVRLADLIRLGLTSLDEVENSSEKKVARRLIKAGLVKDYRSSTGLFMLSQRSNDDCIFLDERSRLCTVYEKRPEVCRRFPQIGPRPGFCPHSVKR